MRNTRKLPSFDRRSFLGATGAAGAGLALSGWPRASWAAASNQLVVGTTGDAITLDPGVSFDGTSILLWRGVYEGLLKYDGDTFNIIPNLAESYDVSADKLTYTFKIRPGVTFTDGEKLDAHAVKFNIERQIGTKQGIAYALDPIETIEVPDDMTVVIKIKEFSDAFLSVFAGIYTVSMISPKAIKDHEKSGDLAQGWLRDHMVGTGPFILKSYSQAQQAAFARNPNYWRGWNGNHFDQVFIKYLQEATTERLLLEQNQIDVSLFLPDDMVQAMDGEPGITVTDIPSDNLYYIVLPCDKGPTKDVRVRQAMSYGFDYGTWIKDFMHGHAKQAHGPLPSTMVGYDPTTPQYHYDPDKARQLLAEAGYPKGGFTIDYIYESGYWWKRPLGELFQSNMKDLGIKVTIQEMSPSAWTGVLSNPQTAHQAFGLVWWPTLATPYDFLFSVFATGGQGTAGFNWGYYSNPAYDALINKATHEPDEKKRFKLYGQAQHMLVKDAPALFVYEKNYRLPMRNDLKGFVFNGIYIETLDFYALHKA